MKFLIPVVIGGIIGYFTNWLAIKMLFRPYEEKKIFGLRVPFTPGLIAKERKRLAKNIGSTVGLHLLSTDTIIESLENQKIETKINLWIEKKVNLLKEDQRKLGDLLDNILKENRDFVVLSSKTRLVKSILGQKDRIKETTVKFLRRKIQDLDTGILYSKMEQFLEDQLYDISRSEDIRNKIEDFIRDKSQDSRSLEEILPERFIKSSYSYLDENKAKIGGQIRDAFKDPLIQIQIKSSISDMIGKNLNKMFFALISPDQISDKIFQAVEKYLDDEETDEDIVFVLKLLIGKLMKARFSEMVDMVDKAGEGKAIEDLTNKIIDLLQDRKNHKLLIGFIREKLVDLEDENKEKIIERLDLEIDGFIESLVFENTIFNLVDRIVEEILKKDLAYFFGKIDQEAMNKLYKITGILFKRFASREMPKIVELFNIEKIVADKINSFPVEYFEELILEISHKELRAITWLGGLLGAILGLLSPLLQMIY